MASRFGPGPVFAYEWLTRSRRWQGYALRSLFVLALLVGLRLVWQSVMTDDSEATPQQLARAGHSFFVTMTITELALIFLAAPAATAGAVCLDKSRGTLTHVMVTDLTDREIVLGKLAARLLPILNLVACALPVAALGTLLGGIDPVALTGSVVIVAGVALVGCTLALTISIWASKSHEVMFGVFGCWMLWLLPYPISSLFSRAPPHWLEVSHPFWLALSPNIPGTGSLPLEPILFFAGCLIVSSLLATFSIRKLRPVSLRQANQVPKEIVDSRAEAWFRHEVQWWPGPSLDANPVLWREWRRYRPARPIRIIGTLYVVLVSMISLYLIGTRRMPPGWAVDSFTAAIFQGAQVSIGLLFVAASAGTVLSEERTRGSLDVLMTTPLSTRSIVWGKWWGTYRRAYWLAFWPFLMAYLSLPDQFEPWLASLICFLPIVILAQCAALTSLGLALATWISRPGMVVNWTIAIVVASVVGWPIAGRMIPHLMSSLALGSPFINVYATIRILESQTHFRYGDVASEEFWKVQLVWSTAYAVVAGGLYLATLLTFERCLGRTPQRGKRSSWPGLRGSGSRTPSMAGRPATGASNSGRRPR